MAIFLTFVRAWNERVNYNWCFTKQQNLLEELRVRDRIRPNSEIGYKKVEISDTDWAKPMPDKRVQSDEQPLDSQEE